MRLADAWLVGRTPAAVARVLPWPADRFAEACILRAMVNVACGGLDDRASCVLDVLAMAFNEDEANSEDDMVDSEEWRND